MKIKKMFIINCIILISLLLIYRLLEYILRGNNLTFTNPVIYTFASIFTVLLLSILVQIVIILFNIARKKTIKLSIRIISGLGVFMTTFSIVIFLILGLFAFVFSYEPEHIVEKNGKKMVACVNSFLQVNVNYYDYVNPLVRGNKLKISEDYGNGGYDPFELDETPKAKWYTYYDDNGNVIKSNRLN